MEVYADSFLVIVQRKIISCPFNAEHIVATVKIFPLKKDYCADGVFESYDVASDQLERFRFNFVRIVGWDELANPNAITISPQQCWDSLRSSQPTICTHLNQKALASRLHPVLAHEGVMLQALHIELALFLTLRPNRTNVRTARRLARAPDTHTSHVIRTTTGEATHDV